MATIGSLVVTVAANAEPFRRGLKQAKTEHEQFTDHILKNKAFKDSMGPQAGIAGMMDLVGPVAIGAAAAGVGKLISVLQDAANSFEETSNRAQQFGMTFNEMRGVEILGDALSGELIVGMSKFQKLLGEAATGSKEAQQTFEKLGMDWKKLSEMAPGDALGETMETIAGLDSQLERANASVELFGKNGAALLPILNQGKAGIKDAREMASALSLSGVDQARLSKLDNMFDGMGHAWKSIKENSAAFVAGGAQQMLMDRINPKLGDKMRAEAEAAAKAAESMKKFSAAQREAADKAKELQGAIEKTIEKFQEQADFAGMDPRQREIEKHRQGGADAEQLAKLREEAAFAREAEDREKLLDEAAAMNNKLDEQAALFGKIGHEAEIAKLKIRGLNDQSLEQLGLKAQANELRDVFGGLDEQLRDFGKDAGDKMLDRLMELGANAEQVFGAIGALNAMDQANAVKDLKDPGTFSAQMQGSSEELSSRNRLRQGLQFKDAKEKLQEEANKILEDSRKELAKILKELQGEQKPKVVQMN